MNILNTSFGIIRKLDTNTFILPSNLTGRKLLTLQKKHKDFFASFVVIPLTEKEKTAKLISEKSRLFSSSFFLTITNTVPEKTIFFMFGIILAFVFCSFLVVLIAEKRRKNKETQKVSFNNINSNF